MASFADLVKSLHSNLESFHKCIESLSSTQSHDEELEKLEQRREAKIAAISKKYEAEAVELESQRKAEEEVLIQNRKQHEKVLALQRKKEEEEIAARRKREDDEIMALFEEDGRRRMERKKQVDIERERRAEAKREEIQEQIEQELERIEEEMERAAEEGKKMLLDLDEKRKAINAQIDAALKMPIVLPTMKFRSRAKLGESRLSGGATIDSNNGQTGAISVVGATTITSHNHITREKSSTSEPPLENKIIPSESVQPATPIEEDLFSDGQQEDTNSSTGGHASTDSDSYDGYMLENDPVTESIDDLVKNWKHRSGVYNFFEEQRPMPSFTQNHTSLREYRFQEISRPIPSFVYRFKEENRPFPSFEEVERPYKNYHFSEELRPSPLFDDWKGQTPMKKDSNNPMPQIETTSGCFHFSEDNRPMPLFYASSSNYIIHRFLEKNRPMPLFSYHFSEEARPLPVFNSFSDIPRIYRFTEELRPSPSFEDTKPEIPSKNNPNVFVSRTGTIIADYHFSEENRPMPLFYADTPNYRVHRFSEGKRPKPSFVYRFSEHSRPLPTFNSLIDTPRVYHFSEEKRPKPFFIYRFSEERRPLPALNSLIHTSNIYHFSEEQRPRPSFITMDPISIHLVKPPTRVQQNQRNSRFNEDERPVPEFQNKLTIYTIYRFSEQHRPKPAFTYHFSEIQRPLPIFSKTPDTIKIYRFLESQRPKPSFELASTSPATSMPATAAIPAKKGQINGRVFRFSEKTRPSPSFTHGLILPNTYHFSEETRPHPVFIYNFSEGHRPDPIFRDISPTAVYHFSEDSRPLPQFDINPRSRDKVSKHASDESPSTRSQPIYIGKPGDEIFPGHEKPQRKSGLFLSFVDAIKADVPIVNRLVNSQEYNSVPPDDFDPYSDDTYDHNIDHQSTHLHNHHIDGIYSNWQGKADESDEEFPIRSFDSDLHIETSMADIVPHFESSYHSDVDESPATPSDAGSSPFLENPIENHEITTSWLPPRGELQGQKMPSMKPQVSPLRADFERTYPNVTPKSITVNVKTSEVPEYLERAAESKISEDTTRRETTTPVRPLQSNPFRISRIPTVSNRDSIGDTLVDFQSTPISQNPFFQKTRSLFDTTSRPSSQTTKPAVGPKPTRSRPTSFQAKLLSPENEIVPKCLDRNGKPPSPAFTLPKTSQGNGTENRVEKVNPFLDGLSRLVGSGGLESSIHSPATFTEKDKLLGEDAY